MPLENPSVIGNVNAKLPSEETTHAVKIEAPTVDLDEQISKSEAQATGEQIGISWSNTPPSNKSRKHGTFIISPDWLPKGWLTEVRTRETGRRDKYYHDPVTLRQFRTRKEVSSFLEKGKLDRYKSRPKMKPEREFGDETKGLSGTLSKIYPSASNIDGISPYSASCASLLPSTPCTIPSSITHNSDLLVANKCTSPLTSSPSSTFRFTPQLGAVNNLSIPTGTPISHLHFSAAAQNAINPDTIRRPTKVRWVLNGPEGSWVPIFNEEKPIKSYKKEGKVDVFSQ